MLDERYALVWKISADMGDQTAVADRLQEFRCADLLEIGQGVQGFGSDEEDMDLSNPLNHSTPRLC